MHMTLGLLAKAGSFVGYAVINFFIGAAILIAVALSWEALGFQLPRGDEAMWGFNIAAQIAAIPLTVLFRRYWIRRGIEEAAKEAARKHQEARHEAWRAAHADKKSPGRDILDAAVGVVFSLVGFGVLLVILLALGYALSGTYGLISSISVPFAILIGAIFIGFCILVARR